MTSEQHQGLIELLTIRFDRLDARLEAMADRLGGEAPRLGVTGRLASAERRLASSKGRLASIEGRLARVNDRLTGVDRGTELSLRDRVRAIAGLAAENSPEAAVSTRFDDHERRIVRLEQKDSAP